MQAPPAKPSAIDLRLANVVLFCLILASAQAGLTLATVHDYGALIWLPTSFALVGMLLWGYRLWPAILAAATISNYLHSQSLGVAIGCGAAAVAEAAVATYMLRQVGFRRSLERIRDVFALVIVSAGLAAPLSASLGTLSLGLGGMVPLRDCPGTWLAWWLGDSTSALIVAPMMLVWSRWPAFAKKRARLIETAALATAAIVLSLLTAYDWHPYIPAHSLLLKAYLLVALLVWAALRYGQYGTTATVLAVASIGLGAALNGEGPFHKSGRIPDLICLQAALGLGVVTMMVLAAAVCEMKAALLAVQRGEQRLRKVASEYRAMFELSGAGHVQADARTGLFVRANRKACELLGYREEELQRRSLFDLLHPGDSESCHAELRQLLSGVRREISQERRFFCQSGGVLWATLTATLTRDDAERPLRLIAVLQDSSERRRAETNLVAAKEAAEAANRAKSVFLANVSHEIRTPLGAILGFTEFLLDPTQTEADRAYCVQTIKRNGDLLSRIIDDVLDLSKIEANRLDIEWIQFSLAELIQDVMSVLSFKAQEKGITLHVQADSPLPRTMISDPTRLRQILLNVIGNAVKFAEHGRVDVLIQMQPSPSQGEKRLTFLVRDTGPGLSPEQAARLFQPFSQADSSMARRYGGTGLGLFLSKKLARALGGDLCLVESVVGAGSSFLIHVAAGEPATDTAGDLLALTPCLPSSEALTDTKPLLGRHILLVEDSPDNQLLISRIVDRAGASVELATDGWEGISKASVGNHDLVLMDIQMPGIDGYEATRTLRARGYGKPIIALTAHAMKDERAKALSQGFDDYLTKPIQKENLIASISRLASTLHVTGTTQTQH